MQLKRIFTIFLAAALIFSSLTVNVGAETVETFELGVVAESATPVSTSPKIFNSGDDVSVKISVDQNTGISFLDFVVFFDANVLEYVGFSSSKLFGSGEKVQIKDDYVRYWIGLNEKVSEDLGELLSLNFRIKSGYCGVTQINTKLFRERTANCAKYYSAAENTHVPFIAGKDSFTIHSIDSTTGAVTEATCVEQGYTTYECAVCNQEVKGNFTAELGHDYDAVVTEPTCTEQGYTTHTCSRCDDTYVDDNVDELGHDLIHHEAKDPSCTEVGWDAYDTCSRCDYTTYNELPALGHDYGEITVIEPDYQNEGYSTHTCAKCGYEEKFDFVPALTYIPGDVNGDETVNDSDAVYLLMHVFFPEDYPINQSGDFNGDNSVNDSDAVYLLMYVFFPEDYPLA